MGNIIDITGCKFNHLTAIRRAAEIGSGYTHWIFRCECGVEKAIQRGAVAGGWTKSCGCRRLASISAGNTTHGATKSGKTPEYSTWRAMIDRCERPTTNGYERYGGAGIKVCARWRSSFENFLADMGKRPDGASIERKDSKGNYEPSNCRWATRFEQQNNRKNNHFIEHDGLRLTIAQWSEKLGINNNTLAARIAKGWIIGRALNPILTRNTKRRKNGTYT